MIGLLGGTFDPVHYGHLRPALEAVETLALDELRLIPAARPPHRAAPAAPATERVAMVSLAVAGESRFRVDARELSRTGPSYTVDTLESLRAEVGTTPLVLLLGMDAFLGLHTWHRWERLAALAHLAVMTRPGAAPAEDMAAPLRPLWAARVRDAAALRARPAGHLITLQVTALGISASQLRAQAAAGRSLRFLTPDAVCEHIAHHGLYRPAPPAAGTSEA
ncbi:nicotinate-nucleotide adenylyltransferase [Ectothiorhodospiraceae bacterium 2226]|nr:nicotinate-nucleotide adenylyltransferase [Ectothiorhodospiraceae bacterium 2226]